LTVLLLLAVLVGGTAIGVWVLLNRMHANGIRFEFGPPGAALAGGEALPVIPDPDLAAAGVRVKVISVTSEGERMIFLVRERYKLLMWLSAGNETLDTNRVGYTVLDADGGVLSQGVVGPSVRIEAGKTVSTEIDDACLAEAARVELRKLP
jgi:hypothetical protein